MASNKVDMKVVMLGKEYVGKTCIVKKYLDGKFNESTPYQATIGAAFGARRILINGKAVVMGIWDTAGSERYEAMSRIYYRGARAAIVCYDITDKSSFNRLQFWVNELQKNEAECRIYLCGTKKDLIDLKDKPRQVDFHDARNFAADIHAEIFETSSKTGENIGELFTKIAEDYSEDQINIELIKRSTVDITKSDQPKSKCKC